MIKNYHYYIHNLSKDYVFLLNISYNYNTKRIELQSLGNSSIFDAYTLPSEATWDRTTRKTPIFIIVNNLFQQAIGFNAIDFIGTNVGLQESATDTIFSSTFTPGLGPVKLYSPVTYKPNNYQFSQQGGVDSGSFIARLKYNTLNTNASSYLNTYGASVSNALAYGVPDGAKTYKDRIGYPMTMTPIINKYTGEMTKCMDTTFSL
jgi:hypothetical protein